jgi:hypothetical protein
VVQVSPTHLEKQTKARLSEFFPNGSAESKKLHGSVILDKERYF